MRAQTHHKGKSNNRLIFINSRGRFSKAKIKERYTPSFCQRGIENWPLDQELRRTG